MLRDFFSNPYTYWNLNVLCCMFNGFLVTPTSLFVVLLSLCYVHKLNLCCKKIGGREILQLFTSLCNNIHTSNDYRMRENNVLASSVDADLVACTNAGCYHAEEEEEGEGEKGEEQEEKEEDDERQKEKDEEEAKEEQGAALVEGAVENASNRGGSY
ncbi:hypothetical protein SprV_0802648200 [Sparganum proliferum]